jgi:hypothetical protein
LERSISEKKLKKVEGMDKKLKDGGWKVEGKVKKIERRKRKEGKEGKKGEGRRGGK